MEWQRYLRVIEWAHEVENGVYLLRLLGDVLRDERVVADGRPEEDDAGCRTAVVVSVHVAVKLILELRNVHTRRPKTGLFLYEEEIVGRPLVDEDTVSLGDLGYVAENVAVVGVPAVEV